MEDGDVGVDGGAGEGGAGLGELGAELRDFGVEGNGGAVGADEGAVVFLLAVEGGAPLPVGDGVGAVADVVPGHGADVALVEGVVVDVPVDEAGLGFHDPEVLAEEAAGEVVGGAVGDGVEVAGADVVVPGGEVEVLGDGVVIVAVEEAHHVGGDELAGVGVGADDVELILLVAAPGVGDEALPAEEEAGVAVGGLDGDLATSRCRSRSSRRWSSLSLRLSRVP